MSREINGIHDVTEEDVENVYETLELVRALSDFAGEQEPHKGTFNESTLSRVDQYLTMLWQSLAVVVAAKKEREISAADLMEGVAKDE